MYMNPSTCPRPGLGPCPYPIWQIGPWPSAAREGFKVEIIFGCGFGLDFDFGFPFDLDLALESVWILIWIWILVFELHLGFDLDWCLLLFFILI